MHRSISRLSPGLAGLVLLLAVCSAPSAAADRPAQADGKGCISDCDCPPGELCSPSTGTCETAFCPLIFDPVCGLDGKTYGNACQANAAHVVVAGEGSCPETCGGITGKRCPEGQLCDLPAGECRGADLEGVCKQRPAICPEVEDPVCGCDGKTYGNDCKRLRAGVQKAHDGKCLEKGKDVAMYGCRSNADCSRAGYCQFPFGECGGAGRCEPRPQLCPQIFMPVCGCDGRTYSNSCVAAAAGVSVRSDGECR